MCCGVISTIIITVASEYALAVGNDVTFPARLVISEIATG